MQVAGFVVAFGARPAGSGARPAAVEARRRPRREVRVGPRTTRLAAGASGEKDALEAVEAAEKETYSLDNEDEALEDLFGIFDAVDSDIAGSTDPEPIQEIDENSDVNQWLDDISEGDFGEPNIADEISPTGPEKQVTPSSPRSEKVSEQRDSLDEAGKTLFEELGLFFDDDTSPRQAKPNAYRERENSYERHPKRQSRNRRRPEALSGLSESQQMLRDEFRGKALNMLKSPPPNRKPIEVVRDAFDIVETNGFYPNRMMYNLAFRNLAKRGDLKNTVILYDLMQQRGIKADTYSFSSIFNVCAAARDTSMFQRLFEDIEREELTMNVVLINSALKGYRRAGEVDEMMKLFQDMEKTFGVEPDLRTYNCVMDAHAETGAPDKSEEIFEMISNPDVYNCSALLGAYARNGLLDKAKDFLQRMESYGVKPSVLCNNILLQAYAKNGDNDSAIEFYISMLQESNKDARPNEVTMNTLIDMFAKKGDFVHAMEVVKKMIEDKMTVSNVTFSSLLNACAEAREADLAETLFEQMQRSDVRLDDISYGTFLKALVRSDQRRKAQKIVLSMPEKRRTVQMYNVIIHAFAPDGNVGKCDYLLSLIRKDGMQPDGTTYSALLYACARARNGRLARTYLQEIVGDRLSVRAPTLLSAMFAFLADKSDDFSEDAAFLLRYMVDSRIIRDAELQKQLELEWLTNGNFHSGRRILREAMPNVSAMFTRG